MSREAMHKLTCRGCGGSFEFHRRKAYCSDACRQSSKREPRECESCGKSFLSASARFCSPACRPKPCAPKSDRNKCGRCNSAIPFDRSDAAKKAGLCQKCHTEAVHERKGHAKLLNSVGRMVWNAQRKWRSRVGYHYNRQYIVMSGKCRICGCPSRCEGCAGTYCERCYTESRSRQKRHAKHSRRAAVRGAKVEAVNNLLVYERDGWACYLCGVAIRRYVDERAGVMPDEATLDHVVPLSKGGEHSYRNVRACCRACNNAKGCDAVDPPPGGVFLGSV